MRGIVQGLKGRTFDRENISSAIDKVLPNDPEAARVAKAYVQEAQDTHTAG